MKTVTRIAGLDVQTKCFAETVRAAQMRVTLTAAFIRADEHDVVMRRVLVEHFLPGKVRNNVGVQPACFKKIREHAVHICIRNRWSKRLLLGWLLLLCLRINRLHALTEQHGHRFDVTLAVIFLYEADSATALV